MKIFIIIPVLFGMVGCVSTPVVSQTKALVDENQKTVVYKKGWPMPDLVQMERDGIIKKENVQTLIVESGGVLHQVAAQSFGEARKKRLFVTLSIAESKPGETLQVETLTTMMGSFVSAVEYRANGKLFAYEYIISSVILPVGKNENEINDYKVWGVDWLFIYTDTDGDGVFETLISNIRGRYMGRMDPPAWVFKNSKSSTVPVTKIKVAEALFQYIVRLEASFDVSVCDLYADRAIIHSEIVLPDGTTQKSEINGFRRKVDCRKDIPLSKARQDITRYSDISYHLEGDRVRIKANRYSKMKDYSAPYSILVGLDYQNSWKIFEEWTETRP